MFQRHCPISCGSYASDYSCTAVGRGVLYFTGFWLCVSLVAPHGAGLPDKLPSVSRAINTAVSGNTSTTVHILHNRGCLT